MPSDFEHRCDERLESFDEWCAGRSFSACRLVHYAGLGEPNAIDVELGCIRSAIVGCLEEGLSIDWATCGDRLYLGVQEPGCPMPGWDYVFTESAVVDVDELLRQSGF